MEFKKTALSVLLSVCAASAADYSAWTLKKDIVLNTSATGANVAGTVTNFPVLIRLGSAESAIITAGGANGSGIRFSKADGTTALPYQIESWSSTSATIWVKVDSVKGNNASQKIVLHYNNSATVSSESNGANVFDTANGFRGVWHLNDSAGAKSTDATVLNTNAQWYNTPVLTDGLIGKAVNTNQPEGVSVATANHLRAAYNTTNNNFKATSANGITLSAWVKHHPSSGGQEQGILGRYNWGVNARQAIIGLNNANQIRVYRSVNGLDGANETNFGTQTIEDGAWTHIVATVKNGSQILYVNGVQNVAQTTATVGSLDSVFANSALAFGHMAPDHAGNGVNQAFNGIIDEARFAVTTRDSNWIKLEYQNQKLINTLTTVGQPTAPSAPGTPTGVASNAQVAVTWTAPANNGGAPITSYTVTSTPGSLTCATTGALTCTVTGLTNGTGYTFQVKATNAVGTSVNSAASGTLTPAAQLPGAPTGLVVTQGPTAGALTVTWQAAPANGAAITGYTVTSTPGSLTCTTTGALTCAVTGLAASTPYTFQVKATNSVGTGVNSAPSSAVTGINGQGNLVFSVGNFTKAYTFQLPENAASLATSLTLSISDVSGKTVWSKTVNPSKVREIGWNGLTSKGARVSSGMYIARVKVANAAGSQETMQIGVKLRN